MRIDTLPHQLQPSYRFLVQKSVNGDHFQDRRGISSNLCLSYRIITSPCVRWLFSGVSYGSHSRNKQDSAGVYVLFRMPDHEKTRSPMAHVSYCRALSESSRDWFDDCRRAELGRSSSILSADVPGRDGFVDATLALTATEHVPLSIGVALPTRSPLQTALAAASIASFGRRLVLGLGIGTPTTNEHSHGVGYRPPLARLRSFTECVLAVLRGRAGEPVEIVTDHHRAASPGLGLGADRVPVVIGAQGPKTLRWAARHSDGVILHLMTARPVLRNRISIISVNRDRARPFHLSTGMVVSVDPDEERALHLARADLTVAMSRPWYKERLAEAAGRELSDEFAGLVGLGRWKDAARLLTDDLVRDFILVSTPDRVMMNLAAVDEVDEVVPVGCGNFYSHLPEPFGLTRQDAAVARAELREAILAGTQR